MSAIIYEQLTRNEIDFLVTNDCGGKFFDVPDFTFAPACWRHDVRYWVGNTKEDRLHADLQFYYDMQTIVDDMPWYRRVYMRTIPWIYYYAVRIGASSSFHWGKRRTYENLQQAMMLADHSDDLPEGWNAQKVPGAR